MGIDRKNFQQLESSEGTESQDIESQDTESQDTESQHRTPITARNSKATPVGEQPTKQPGGHQSVASADARGSGSTDETEQGGLKRQLKSRHIQMIALAGAIVGISNPGHKTKLTFSQGTGLFLSLGGALQTGGPLGALLGYSLIGLVACAVQYALGEVSALYPETGAFVRHGESPYIRRCALYFSFFLWF